MKNKAVRLLGQIKKETTRNVAKPYRFRHAGRIDKYFRTKDEAETFQSNYSEQEAKVGVDKVARSFIRKNHLKKFRDMVKSLPTNYHRKRYSLINVMLLIEGKVP
jgi:hypothetical protein